MPLKYFDIDELRRAGAIDTDTTWKCDLDSPIHSIFAREKWNLSDEDYNLLLPSIRLASKFISVAILYMTRFLPPDKIYGKDLRTEDQQDGIHELFQNIAAINISAVKRATNQDLQIARQELERVATTVNWQVSKEMRYKHWLGVCRVTDKQPLSTQETRMDVALSDSLHRLCGDTQRSLTIGVTHMYIELLRGTIPNSERNLRVTVIAAYTLTHEIGHAIYHTDFRSYNPPYLREPFSSRFYEAELGSCMMAWLFGGFDLDMLWDHNPNLFHESDEAAMFELKLPLYWRPWWGTFGGGKLTGTQRLQYKPTTATSMKFVRKLLSKDFWDSLGDPSTGRYMMNARAALNAITDISPESATANIREWSLCPRTNAPRWIRAYSIPELSAGEFVRGLSDDEILEMKRDQDLRAKHKADAREFTWSTSQEQDLTAEEWAERRAVRRAVCPSFSENEYDPASPQVAKVVVVTKEEE